MSLPNRMFAIASLLNPAADKATQELWQWLEWDCGLKGIRLTPTPHFSWVGAVGFEQEKLEAALSELVKGVSPFQVRTTGLGIFTAPAPVLYLSIAKTRMMLDFHERLWNLAAPSAQSLIPYYGPEHWVPHITLANKDVTPENLACAVSGLLYQPVTVDIIVDHLVLLYLIGEEVGMLSRFDFND